MDEKDEDELICSDCGRPLSEHADDFESKEEFVEVVANSYVDAIFEDFWEDMKEDFELLSKKELAEEVFFHAVASFLDDHTEDKENDFDEEGDFSEGVDEENFSEEDLRERDR